MTLHTDQEFEIVRRASRLFQEASETWMARALVAESKLAEIDKAIDEYRHSQIWDQQLQEIIDK